MVSLPRADAPRATPGVLKGVDDAVDGGNDDGGNDDLLSCCCFSWWETGPQEMVFNARHSSDDLRNGRGVGLDKSNPVATARIVITKENTKPLL